MPLFLIWTQQFHLKPKLSKWCDPFRDEKRRIDTERRRLQLAASTLRISSQWLGSLHCSCVSANRAISGKRVHFPWVWCVTSSCTTSKPTDFPAAIKVIKRRCFHWLHSETIFEDNLLLFICWLSGARHWVRSRTSPFSVLMKHYTRDIHHAFQHEKINVLEEDFLIMEMEWKIVKVGSAASRTSEDFGGATKGTLLQWLKMWTARQIVKNDTWLGFLVLKSRRLSHLQDEFIL